MVNINSKTRIVGLLGCPLGHSLSPEMQNTAFSNTKINYVYIALEIKAKNFDTVVKGILGMNFVGLNVTIPYKLEILKHLDEIEKTAKCIGAVNTVVIKDSKFIGYNTDGIGFLRSLEEGMGSTVKNKSIFVLGSGGASRAICSILAFNKVKKIIICNRTFEKAIALSRDINSHVSCNIEVIEMHNEKIKKSLEEADILINTTSVGTSPKIEEAPIDTNLLNKKLVVYDVIYNPRKTKLLKEAEKLGCKVISGLGMLVYQGVEAFELWTGVEAPTKLMLKTVDRAINKM